MNSFFAAFLVACIVTLVAGECPSACSGHGTCGAYDACSCFRNWMSNDCSERICPFGLAHVDTPMGDLDASSGQLTGPGSTGVPGSGGDQAIILNSDMYPSGVTEQYPAMKNSRGTILTESAHYYRECSNKGICDRSSGECECFEGYEGSSCQRASCPTSGNGECSGHGTCHTIQELAAFDHENVYRLWDEDITMGCKCDAGYTGPDCSSRTCKMGYDPLYYDDFQNVRHANYTVQFYVMNDDAVIYGNYSLVFTDVFGEDWETEPIDIDANCGVIQDRLESLPNDVIPWGTVKCYKSEENLHISGSTATSANPVPGKFSSFTNVGGNGQEDTLPVADGQKKPAWKDYTKDFALDGGTDTQARGETIYSHNHYAIVNKFILAFPGNPGEIPPLKINRYLDGARPTLFSTETGNTLKKKEQTLGVHIYANGFHGETTDYVNDECEGVLVSLQSKEVVKGAGEAVTDVADAYEKYSHYLGFDSDIEFERLKRCLGDSDGVSTNNVEVYDWDYGSFMNPHLIKLVDATQDRFVEYLRSDGSSYKVLAQDDDSHLSTPMGGGVGDNTGNWQKDTEGLGSFLNMPMSKLCSRGQPWQNDNYMKANSKFPYRSTNALESNFEASKFGNLNYNRGSYGWCRALDPPGFFAVVYFDDCTDFGVTKVHSNLVAGFVAAADKYDETAKMCGVYKTGFRLLTRPATDYSTETKFHVFTTKGTLQQVSAHSGAYTQSYTERIMDGTVTNAAYTYNADFFHSLHSNVIHTTNVTVSGGQGQVDCETALKSNGEKKYLNYDCLNKGDKIFLIALGDMKVAKTNTAYSHNNIAGQAIGTSYFYESTANSLMANPLYPNMYTVEKIGKEVKNPNAADQGNLGELHAEAYRQQITLNMGVNAQYMKPPDAVADADFPGVLATIYKFHPPALNSTGTTGYNYVGECSNRGICDSDSGICECFTGFTGQNCGVINSLAE